MTATPKAWIESGEYKEPKNPSCRKHGSIGVYRVRLKMINVFVHRCESCNLEAGRQKRSMV